MNSNRIVGLTVASLDAGERLGAVTELSLDLQKDALTAAGCESLYTDVISGTKESRLGLDDALSYIYIRKGSTLVG